MAAWTFLEGNWHPGNPPIMGPMTHAAWLASTVFDGARVEVSSSREAARLLLDREGTDPQKLGDMQMGDACRAPPMTSEGSGHAGQRSSSVGHRGAWLIAGAVIMSVLIAILALAAVPQSATISSSPQATTAPAAETEAVRAARAWLALHDDGRWRESYDAAGRSFRENNTIEVWTDVAQKVRPPLGAVVSRVLISQESVPTPPAGVQLVKFRTRFANTETVETVSLVQEAGRWRVVGIYID